MVTAKDYLQTEKDRMAEENDRSDDERSHFERDRARLIHSAAFRRLQGKTQVFGQGTSDFFRTRLTHSLEAAQIGKGLALLSEKADSDLVEFACMAHDIGHPPFGHVGEDVLKEAMKEYGGFEGNAQNLRILHYLEIKSDKYTGLNLTRASVDSLIKYPVKYSDIYGKISNKKKWKFYYDADDKLVKWAKEGCPVENPQSFECQIMNWSDDIAYSTHDLEDGLKSGMITYEKVASREAKIRERLAQKNQWDENIWKEIMDNIGTLSKPSSDYYNLKIQRKKFISNLVNDFIHNTKFEAIKNSSSLPQRYRYMVVKDSTCEAKSEMLKGLVWETIISDERVVTLERKGKNIVKSLFDQFTLDEDSPYELLPADFRKHLSDDSDDKLVNYRVVCDYIAGMTDAYALRIYSRLLESDIYSVFDM